jgi:hypothetical protein
MTRSESESPTPYYLAASGYALLCVAAIVCAIALGPMWVRWIWGVLAIWAAFRTMANVRRGDAAGWE